MTKWVAYPKATFQARDAARDGWLFSAHKNSRLLPSHTLGREASLIAMRNTSNNSGNPLLLHTTTWLVTEAACTEASLIVNSKHCKSAALQARLLAVLLILPIRILNPGVHLRHTQSIATQKHWQVTLCISFTTSHCVVNVKIVQRVVGLLKKPKHRGRAPGYQQWAPQKSVMMCKHTQICGWHH